MGDITIPIKTYPYTRKYETKNITKFKYIHYGDIHTGKAKKINEPSKLPSITKGNYSTLRNGDVVVADASEDYKGIADAAILLSTGAFSIIAGLHTIAFRPNRKLVFPMFIYYNLQTSRFKHYGYHVGTGLKVFGISSNLFFDYSAFHPSLIEQQEISKLIESLENLLSLQQRKLKQLKRLKTAMLQQLFVEKNSKLPILRFKNFNGDWKQCKLGELVESLFQGINTAADKVEYSNNGLPIIQAKNITSGSLDFSGSRKLSVQKYSNYLDKYIPQKGDILFANIGTIGPNVILKDTRQFFIAWNILRIVPQKNINGEFLKITLDLLNSKHYFEKLLTGNATKFVNKNDMRNLPIFFSDPEEQNKISNLFKKLDFLITLQQNKLTQLSTLKKYLLQKMFI